MKLPHDATERDYLKAILEVLIALTERAIGEQVFVRVGSLATSSDFASEKTQPDESNVKMLRVHEVPSSRISLQP